MTEQLNLFPVLAGNHREYWTWVSVSFPENSALVNISTTEVRFKGLRYFYLRHADQLKGLRNYTLITYGTWENRSDVTDIFNEYRLELMASGRSVMAEET